MKTELYQTNVKVHFRHYLFVVLCMCVLVCACVCVCMCVCVRGWVGVKRESDKMRYKCVTERQKAVYEQHGAAQCSQCLRWFRSRLRGAEWYSL